MNGLREVFLVANRELRERLRSAAFLATTAIMVIVVAGMMVAPALLSDTLGRFDVRLVGEETADIGDALVATGAQVNMTVQVTTSGRSEAERALAAGEVDAVIEPGDEQVAVVWKSLPNDGWATLVNESLTDVAVERRAAAQGLSVAEVEQLVAPVQPEVRYLDPPIAGLAARRNAALVGMIVLFMAISLFGNFVLTSVVEDKSNRVVEVLLSRLPPRRLLAGKILGIGALGAAQLALLAAATQVASRFAPTGAAAAPSVPPSMLVWIVTWFVLGYVFYSSAYAAAGALASRIEDAQSAVGPLTTIMIAGYFFTFAVVQQDPTSLVSTVASYVPVTAPLTMPMRLAVGAAPWWEGVIAVVVMALATYGLIRASGRVYRGAVLRVGSRVHWLEAWRAGGDDTLAPRSHASHTWVSQRET